MGAGHLLLSCAALILLSACGGRTGLGIDDNSAGAGGADALSRGPEANDRLPPGCLDEDLVVHLLSDRQVVYKFDPVAITAERIGQFNCGEPLNSMSIGLNGDAYVASQTGGLFRVDLETLSCRETAFDRSTLWGQKFTMGFVANTDMAETLYIVEQPDQSLAGRLSFIELDLFTLVPVGWFDPFIPAAEITGTGDGRIFGFVTPSSLEPARLVEIDRATVAVRTITELPFITGLLSFDFAFWGGAFYLFVAEDGDTGSTVVRFNLPGGEPEVLGQIEPVVIGAGTSVCAPL